MYMFIYTHIFWYSLAAISSQQLPLPCEPLQDVESPPDEPEQEAAAEATPTSPWLSVFWLPFIDLFYCVSILFIVCIYIYI